METTGFCNVKDQIGFCGIWCGSCAGGNGSIIELTRRYEDVVRKHGLEKWVPKGFDFKEFVKGLSAIQTMSVCPGCRKGGGNPNCTIRQCALLKSVTICSECPELATCANLAQLEKSHPKIRAELTEMKTADRERLMERWMGELAKKWPHCILLCNLAKEA